MLHKNHSNRMPVSVDEAAELLLSDLLLQHLQSLAKMDEKELEMLCERIAPYLLEEFKIWQGNNALLESCFSQNNDTSNDPARIILNRVKSIINDFSGYLVFT